MYLSTSSYYVDRQNIIKPIKTADGYEVTLRSIFWILVWDSMTVSVRSITFLKACLLYMSLMTAQPLQLSQKRTCWQSWYLTDATCNRVFGLSCKNTTAFLLTSVSRRAGWHYFTVETMTHSRTASEEMTSLQPKKKKQVRKMVAGSKHAGSYSRQTSLLLINSLHDAKHKRAKQWCVACVLAFMQAKLLCILV